MQPRQQKQVQVAPSEQSFALQFRPGTPDMAEAERRAASGFLRRRTEDPSNEVFIDFGLLHETTELAHARRTVIAELLVNSGLDPKSVRVRSGVRGIAEDEVNLTVRRYLVTLPGCPDFTSPAGRTFDNRPHSNWGCATAINFGHMVAEPKDILVGRGDTPGDAEALVLSTQRYRAGETTPLSVGDTATADSFGSQGSSGGGSQ